MNASPHAAPNHHPDAPPNGRDSQGRFAKGNPYYRRQAELKRRMLESVTDVDVMSVMRVLLGLARTGDLAAIKLFLEYNVGKPNKEIDPDREELHEWQLQQQTPRLPEVMEVMAGGIEPARANQVTRDMVPIVGACHLKTLSQHLRDGTDYEGNQLAPPLEETPPPLPPDRNGSKRSRDSARCLAAAVQPAVETGDNGAGPLLNELFAEVVRAVHSVENGPERATRGWRQTERITDRPDQPDSR